MCVYVCVCFVVIGGVAVCMRVRAAVGKKQTCKLKWYRHVTRTSGLVKIVLEGYRKNKEQGRNKERDRDEGIPSTTFPTTWRCYLY